ncbi:MAG: nucleoside hydrolase [Candidatus Latescibacterota bacterium]|nr:nucleoside hydrolase [Candidatus Latescibacterota bacterium]
MGQGYPLLSDEQRLQRLHPPAGRVRMVLDTDTYNEVDDQFAVAHALLSPESMEVEALYAAPFHNSRSDSPEDGMEKSHEEILRILDYLSIDGPPVMRGSTRYLSTDQTPVESDAAIDLVSRARDGVEPLYVVAIGAITNVASAILMDPAIVEHLVVVWLGGHSSAWPDTEEFNLTQDPDAARVIFDCGVPFVRVPCYPVASHLLTTLAELETHLVGKTDLCDFLVDRVRGYSKDHFAWAKEIWDISATVWLVDSSWVPTQIVHSPILAGGNTWSHNRSRHLMREAISLHRNPIFKDLFRKLTEHS